MQSQLGYQIPSDSKFAISAANYILFDGEIAPFAHIFKALSSVFYEKMEAKSEFWDGKWLVLPNGMYKTLTHNILNG